jgi:hypothetical protein
MISSCFRTVSNIEFHIEIAHNRSQVSCDLNTMLGVGVIVVWSGLTLLKINYSSCSQF